ncbi:triacylglycerol lipase [uncultured Corynebacterium sp.]|uniref:esterase/lipase family protein n=1 Tax=uncultured Corynebacterium sp. TaxID=159447 RepID=UPI0025933A87|nr:alpha/beta fold hydrolase [uncultured Corynebacterium sp.]
MMISRPRPALATTVAASALLATSTVAAATPSSAPLGSALSSSTSGSVINDPSCVPSAEHPYPVVILHGTSANMWEFDKFAHRLSEEGYCAYGTNYGKELLTAQAIVPSLYGTADLESSSEEVAAFIDSVLARTGAEKVDIVAHSQGALHAKNYISRYGNADKVDRVVTMGASLHGTTLNGFGEILATLTRALPRLSAFFASTAAIQQLIGSATMNAANSYPDTAPGITYTSMYSPSDTTVTPNSASQFAAVPGANVVNINAETVCSPTVAITHQEMPSNPRMMALAMWGLTRDQANTSPTVADCAWS